jgi:hypothetical protein
MPALNSIASSNNNIGSSLTTQSLTTLTTTPPPGSSSSSPTVAASAITSALTSVLSSLGALSPSALTSTSVKALSGSLPNSMASTQANSTNTNLTNIKATPISDPISASLAATPPGTASSANTFLTSPFVNQIQPINFSPTSNTAAINLAQTNPAQINSVSARLGITPPTNDTALAALTQIAFTGAAALISGTTPSNQATLLTTTVLTPVSTIPIISSAQTAYIQNNSAILSDVPNISSILASNWDSSLPLAADAAGALISGMPGGTDPNIIAAIAGLATNTCGDYSIPTITSYASEQSLTNTLMSLILGGNLTAMFTPFAACPSLFTQPTQTLVAESLPATAAAGSAALVAAAISALGPGQVGNVPSLITSLATQPVPEVDTVSSLNTIMTTTSVPSTVVFGAGMSGSAQIWNAQTINSCNPTVMAGVLGADTANLASAIMSF